jgi:hypothetical protein
MGSLTWNGSSGDWSTASNWSLLSGLDPTPGAGDDVTINAPGAYVVTITDSQSVHDLTLAASGATVAIVAPLVGHSGTLALNGALTGGGGTLDLTRGGLTFTNSQSIDNLTISFISPPTAFAVPFTMASDSVLTLGPHVLMQGSTNSTPVAILANGGGTLVNDGTITSPQAVFGLMVTNSALDNEGSINIGTGFTVNGDLTNNGELRFGGAGLAALTVNGNLSGLGRIILPSGLGAAPITVSGTIGAQDLIGPLNGQLALTAKAINSLALIDNFAIGSSIDLTGLSYSTNLKFSYDGSNASGSLNITNDGTLQAQLAFRGIPQGAGFALSPDATGGTVITTDLAVVPCFATGTRIRTDGGEVAVEQLRVGDHVPVVRAGRPLQIIWIGHRRVLPARHPEPEEVYPVRVTAGAFADAVPHRDLWLSPEHSVFLHGVLVPIRVLINGTSIAQIPCAEVTYWHVELESHDLMLCEGAWTESYLEMGNRSAFDGTSDATAPDFSRQAWEARACQQQERGGPIVAAIRAVIDARTERAA